MQLLDTRTSNCYFAFAVPSLELVPALRESLTEYSLRAVHFRDDRGYTLKVILHPIYHDVEISVHVGQTNQLMGIGRIGRDQWYL